MNVSDAFKSRSMLRDHVLRNGFSRESNPSLKLLPGPSSHMTGSLTLKHRKVESVLSTVNKLVKGKLGLGAKILQAGGIDKVFRRIFSIREGEQLLRACQCSLYTTAGPIPGRLFVSTHKLAFCSDRPVAKVSSPDGGGSLRFHYKIVIPHGKIKNSNQSENIKKSSHKYLQVVTTDGFDFWFTGLLSNKKIFKCLQQALSQTMIC
ncbi:GEM-like protein 4 [Silene latifolia]|uniref:GEM-like protein 4 n=1 Tax=Silene latifolia TaxID=37657 RepID=UPI003D7854E7